MKQTGPNFSSRDKILEEIDGGYQFRCFKDNGVIGLFTAERKDYRFSKQAILNRQSLLEKLNLDSSRVVHFEQEHSSDVVCVDDFRLRQTSGHRLVCADGLISSLKNLALAVFIADCLAVYFLDPRKRVIGLAHAGWRGTLQEICKNLIQLLSVRFQSASKDLIVTFSPAIRSCCYEVGPEVAKFFKDSVREKNDKSFLDLAAENKRQIIEAGVQPENIIDSEICTCCKGKEFFSYRKEGKKAGRMMALMLLV
ncbi:MAG: peptidoglycan editing factor PgeF [Candidatus Omnitrophica bacterium]|nr:peptidoglycan editing factor PgeF [Candidatus Omnitrophota bacterium]